MESYVVEFVLKFWVLNLKLKVFLHYYIKVNKFKNLKALYFSQKWSKSITIIFVSFTYSNEVW